MPRPGTPVVLFFPFLWILWYNSEPVSYWCGIHSIVFPSSYTVRSAATDNPEWIFSDLHLVSPWDHAAFLARPTVRDLKTIPAWSPVWSYPLFQNRIEIHLCCSIFLSALFRPFPLLLLSNAFCFLMRFLIPAGYTASCHRVRFVPASHNVYSSALPDRVTDNGIFRPVLKPPF